MKEQNNNINLQDPDDRLLLTYISGKSSEEEVRQIENWLKLNDENEKILLQIATVYFAKSRQQRIENRDSGYAYEQSIRRIRNRQRISTIKKWSVAASWALIFVLITMTVYYSQKSTTQHRIVTVQANPGMRSQIELPDGTIVYLNSGSKLKYSVPFDMAQRTVTLIGEAYFKVAHNRDLPFVANTADDRYQVKVTGTEFNMQAFENDTIITTSLVSGKVEVLVKGSDNKNYRCNLSPSEKTSYNMLTEKIKVEKVNTQYETAWIDGKIMFSNCRLPEVLKKLSYSYNVIFEINNPVINNYRLTGVFDNKQLYQILDYLKISSNIQYQIGQTTEDDRLGVKHSTVILY